MRVRACTEVVREKARLLGGGRAGGTPACPGAHHRRQVVGVKARLHQRPELPIVISPTVSVPRSVHCNTSPFFRISFSLIILSNRPYFPPVVTRRFGPGSDLVRTVRERLSFILVPRPPRSCTSTRFQIPTPAGVAESMAATEPAGANLEDDPRKKYHVQSVLGEWGRDQMEMAWRSRSAGPSMGRPSACAFTPPMRNARHAGMAGMAIRYIRCR